MKLLSTLFFAAACSFSFAQYTYVGSTGTSAPYMYNDASASTIIVGTSATSLGDTLSSAQTLPFAWNFYGLPVTQYKASDNGYITFDITATTSEPSNDTPPTVGGPNNAIYCLWDDMDMTDSGTDDEIRSFTYGQTPQRVHVIQWYSMTDAAASGFLYAAIRIYECGDFDIVHNWGTSTGMTATVGCEDATGTDATLVTGSPSIDYPTGASSSDEADDVVYTFYWGSQPDYDLAVISEDLYVYQLQGNLTVSGEIENHGAQTITDFDLNYEVDGGGVVTENLTGLNILPGGTYTYSHSTPWSTTAGNVHTLDVWASNINSGNADMRTCNDVYSHDVTIVAQFANHLVLAEEFTSSTCGPCAAANPGYNTILDNNNVNDAASPGVASIKYQMDWPSPGIDPNYNGEAATRQSFYGVTGIPNLQVDGGWDANPSGFTQGILDDAAAVPSVVDLQMTHTLDGNDVDVEFIMEGYADIYGNPKAFVAIVEDYIYHTVGTTSEVDFYQVFRKFMTPATGQTLGALITGFPTTHNYSETMTFDSNPVQNSYDIWGQSDITLVGWVQDMSTGMIYNSTVSKFALGTGEFAENALQAKLYPNPTSDWFELLINFEETNDLVVEVYDMLGNLVMTESKGQFGVGETTVRIDAQDLEIGNYVVQVISGSRFISKRLTISR